MQRLEMQKGLCNRTCLDLDLHATCYVLLGDNSQVCNLTDGHAKAAIGSQAEAVRQPVPFKSALADDSIQPGITRQTLHTSVICSTA